LKDKIGKKTLHAGF